MNISKYKGSIPPRYLGERILYLRKTKGITRKKVLEYANISNSTLSRIEDGPNTFVSAQTIEKLASLFDVTCDYLITGKECVPEDKIKLFEEIKESPLIYELYTSFNTLTKDKQEKVLSYIDLLSKL